MAAALRVDTVVVSSQHAAGIKHSTIERDLIKHVVMPILPKRLIDRSRPIKFHINPTGQFVKGGRWPTPASPAARSSSTPTAASGSHGGGAFSGKDPSKVDRSASYGARSGRQEPGGERAVRPREVQIAYAIGVPQPVSVMVDTKRTGKVSDEKLTQLVRKHFDLTPQGLIKHLKLRRPIYRATAAYGHFGRSEPSFTWEKTDKARLLARSV
jgi:S-adenosylmethionine synthetase